MRNLSLVLPLAIGLAVMMSSRAAPGEEPRPVTGDVHVHAIAALDGDTFVIRGGRRVRLAGIAAAKAQTVAAREEVPLIVRKAREVLSELVAGRVLRLRFGKTRTDRHRRLVAHAYLDESGDADHSPLWIQGELLRQGVARVATTVDTPYLAPEMLALEQEARSAARGIWGLDFYRILTPEEAASHTGSFQIIEGTVRQAAMVRSRVYLNFGEDWRTDFTVSLDAAARRRFRAADLDPEALGGRAVRVRGWLRSYNGPLIEVTHPEQVEVLAR